MRIFVAALVLLANGSLGFTQEVNWSEIFAAAVSHDSSVVDAVRDRVTGQILPKLCTEPAALASLEVSKIASQLDQKDDLLRLQPSAILFVIATSRQDSAEVLAPVFAKLREHAQESSSRIRFNSVNTLASLNPTIPEQELEFLIEIMKGSDDQLSAVAARGIARMSDSQAIAADALDGMLSQTSSTARKIVAIKALSAAHIKDARLISHLGNLLSDNDQNVVHSALVAISELGVLAIRANLQQITDLTATSKADETVALAKQMLERQSEVQ